MSSGNVNSRRAPNLGVAVATPEKSSPEPVVGRLLPVEASWRKEKLALESQIKRLTLQLRTPSTSEELESAQKDKQQLEELLLQTQKENERCEAEVRRWKSYAKGLEKEIEQLAGPNWQQRLDVPPTPLHAAAYQASTPLTSRNDVLQTPITARNDGWLGGTPASPFKWPGKGVPSEYVTPNGASGHRRTKSATWGESVPEEDGSRGQKARRRISAFMEHEEMVLPALRKASPVGRPVQHEDEMQSDPEHSRTMEAEAEDPDARMQTSDTPASPTANSLSNQLLAALETLSATNTNQATDLAAASRAAEQRRQVFLRGVRKQADGIKTFVQGIETDAEKRVAAIREMMRVAEEQAARWKDDGVMSASG